MTLEGAANLFNIICLAHPEINYFHYGWESDIDDNINNNFTQETTEKNSRGKKYPALHFDFPGEKWDLANKDAKIESTGWLIFSETQYYQSSGGGTDARSILELQNFLQRIALEVLVEYKRLGRQLGQLSPNGQIDIKSINDVRYTANARADNLVECLINITLEYRLDCSDFVANINGLQPPFNSLPLLPGDYELKTFTTP